MGELSKFKIKVFISSAQNKEGEIEWLNIRKKIKERLEKCDYLEPFIIEDVASSMKSSQLMLFAVEKSDLVIQIIKGELRVGTSKEYVYAVENKKPLIVYFINDGEKIDLSVIKHKESIIEKDVCTYKEFTEKRDNVLNYYNMCYKNQAL